MQGPSRPIVIAHRGASGYRPEHTLAAYRLAIDQGANFVEPDLVATRDGVLICRHENALAVLQADGSLNTTDTSTDVYLHPEFSSRLTTKEIDGRAIRGWFSEDFTLREIKTLRALERIPALRPDNTAYDREFEIPTFEELIALVKAQEAATGAKTGIYPETKHPSYFHRTGYHLDGTSISLNLGQQLVDVLVASAFTDPSRVFIQSFEITNLRELKHQILPAARLAIPLIQLIAASGAPFDNNLSGGAMTYQTMLQPAGLVQVANYADGIGPHKHLLIPHDVQNNLRSPTTVIRDAHAAGLLVHPWTFRVENYFLPAALQRGTRASERGDLAGEIKRYLDAGVDGLFCDYPDYAVRSIDASASRSLSRGGDTRRTANQKRIGHVTRVLKSIGILTCGEVRDDLVLRHGEYPAMFKRLLAEVAPHVATVGYRVYAGEYPAEIAAHDGYIISGSRFAVYDEETWIRRLEDYVRALYAARKATVGICFGHQMMARALGGVAEKASQGWGIGKKITDIIKVESWMQPALPHYGVFVSHQDQVTQLPAGAALLATNLHCPNSMFVQDEIFLGIQGHPEFTGDFAHDLARDRGEVYGEETLVRALPTYGEPVDSAIIARWIIQFLARAVQHGA